VRRTVNSYHRNLEIESVIHNNLNNQDAWLVYADWLQSKGDPRGELISLETAANVTDIKNQAAINNEVRNIYAAHKKAWLGESLCKAEDQGVISFGWKYGFINRITCVSKYIAGKHHTFEFYLEDIFKSDIADFITAIDFGNRSYTSRAATDRLLALWQRYPKKHLVSLDLRYNYMSNLPESIGYFTQLTRLNLSGNGLTEIPDSLVNLDKLTHLNLSFNNLTRMPDWIGSLGSIRELSLRQNQIDALPETISQLSELIELDLSVNRLTKLPVSFGQLPKLEKLYLSSNLLSSLSESIALLGNLVKLDASYNNIRSVPESLAKLEQLAELHLSCNRISRIPESLENNKTLKTLYLYGNDNMRISDTLRRRFKVGRNIPW